MRLPLLLAIFVSAATAVVAFGTTASAAPCDGCGGSFATLQADITSIVPAAQRGSFLTRVGLAERLLVPSNPFHPPSPCMSTRRCSTASASTRRASLEPGPSLPRGPLPWSTT